MVTVKFRGGEVGTRDLCSGGSGFISRIGDPDFLTQISWFS